MRIHPWRTIHWWMGKDAFRLSHFPKDVWWKYYRPVLERIIWKIMEPFTNEHWITHEVLREHLLVFGIKNEKIKVVPMPSELVGTVEPVKIEHSTFNILYYHPINSASDKANRNTYGVDIIDELKERYAWAHDFKWIRIDGSQDMETILPVIDVYLRPNRYEGCKSRLIEECEYYNIPYKWSMSDPDIEEFEKFLINQADKWSELQRIKQGHA